MIRTCGYSNYIAITASAAASGTWAPLQTDGVRPSLSVRRDVVYSTDEGDASSVVVTSASISARVASVTSS